MKYRTKGTCSSSIDIEMDGNVIKSVIFTAAATATCRVSPNWWKECLQKMPFPA